MRWIAQQGGMALLITHPDYMSFDGSPNFEEYHPDLYRELLTHLESEYQGEYWHALPREMACFWTRSVGEHQCQGAEGSGAKCLVETPAAAKDSMCRTADSAYRHPSPV